MRIGTRLRKRAREMYEEHREGGVVVGAVKGLSGKSIEMVKKAVWGKMILWNMWLVIFFALLTRQRMAVLITS